MLVTSNAAVRLTQGLRPGTAVSKSTASTSTSTTASGAPPFSVPMPVPARQRPISTVAGVDIYDMKIQPAQVELLPGLRTQAMTYNGSFVGPVIRARQGRPALVRFTNQLDMPANVHLHGGHTPAASDGFPMDLIDPGASKVYQYPNRQPGATLWYHDHSHHMEAEHVFRGLHGIYIVDSDAERDLCLPTGDYDIPIMIRDAEFDADGQFVYGITRSTILVNGRPQPYFPVAARKYRFRLINSATERPFTLQLNEGDPMTQIASDGGLLPAPVPRTSLTFTGGERQEIVIDFSRYPLGSQVFLNDATSGQILRFDVVRRAADDSRVPAVLRPQPPLPPATTVRDVALRFDLSGFPPVGQINGQPFDPARVDFSIKRNTTEIWRISNDDPPGIYHNFHLHLTQFRVLDRDGAPPTLDDAGDKDTILVPSGARNIRVQATFPDYLGKYVYHCHFLEHSSIGMMAVMEITA